MDVSKYRAITNNYQDVRLISLHNWTGAPGMEHRDNGGPYVVVQEGYDPQDFKMRLDEFMLGRSGEWLTIGKFFKLPREVRQREFIFGTAAEVIDVLERLPADAVIIRRGDERMPMAPSPAEDDDLNAAVAEARKDLPA